MERLGKDITSSLLSYGFLAPPTIFIVLCLLGPLAALVWRRTGIAIALTSGLCLFAAATPALSSYLLRQLEAEIAEHGDFAAAQAIVVLGGDVLAAKDDEHHDMLGPASLERVLYAAAAYCGVLGRAHQSLASLMKEILENEIGIPVTWTENESETTWENAALTARLLMPAGISTVVVITNSAHLPRALWSFERAGLHAVPWPVRRTPARWDEFYDFLPSLNALQDTFYAVHEMIGGAYYRLCYEAIHNTLPSARFIASAACGE
jgi:uncharacterized SAM-binding protein YcdF (DUF218 family)